MNQFKGNNERRGLAFAKQTKTSPTMPTANDKGTSRAQTNLRSEGKEEESTVLREKEVSRQIVSQLSPQILSYSETIIKKYFMLFVITSISIFLTAYIVDTFTKSRQKINNTVGGVTGETEIKSSPSSPAIQSQTRYSEIVFTYGWFPSPCRIDTIFVEAYDLGGGIRAGLTQSKKTEGLDSNNPVVSISALPPTFVRCSTQQVSEYEENKPEINVGEVVKIKKIDLTKIRWRKVDMSNIESLPNVELSFRRIFDAICKAKAMPIYEQFE